MTARGTYQWMLSRVDIAGGGCDDAGVDAQRQRPTVPDPGPVGWSWRRHPVPDDVRLRGGADAVGIVRARPPGWCSTSGSRTSRSRSRSAAATRPAGATASTTWRARPGRRSTSSASRGRTPRARAIRRWSTTTIWASSCGRRRRSSTSPGLDAFLATNGGRALQPDHAAQTDLEQDGLTDLETAFDQATLRQTEAGFVLEALPPADAAPIRRAGRRRRCSTSRGRWRECTATRRSRRWCGSRPTPISATTHVLVCDRLGVPIYDQNLDGTWGLERERPAGRPGPGPAAGHRAGGVWHGAGAAQHVDEPERTVVRAGARDRRCRPSSRRWRPGCSTSTATAEPI